MKIIRGNLIQLALDGKFDVIVHGCNCLHTMGAGIAAQIRKTFPEAYEADLQTPRADRKKLGTISYATIRNITVVNAYTQYNWKGAAVLVNYDAVRSAFENIKKKFSGLRIGYPKIGAGLAGGDWELIAKIIDEVLVGEDHTLVEFVR